LIFIILMSIYSGRMNSQNIYPELKYLEHDECCPVIHTRLFERINIGKIYEVVVDYIIVGYAIGSGGS